MSESPASWPRRFAAFFVGVVLLFAVQLSITRLWSVFGVTWSNGNPPVSVPQQIAALSTLFASILASTIGAAVVARGSALSVVVVLGVIGVTIDGYAMFVILGSLVPVWFRFAFVGLIPLATWAGWLFVQARRLPENSRADGA